MVAGDGGRTCCSPHPTSHTHPPPSHTQTHTRARASLASAHHTAHHHRRSTREHGRRGWGAHKLQSPPNITHAPTAIAHTDTHTRTRIIGVSSSDCTPPSTQHARAWSRGMRGAMLYIQSSIGVELVPELVPEPVPEPLLAPLPPAPSPRTAPPPAAAPPSAARPRTCPPAVRAP